MKVEEEKMERGREGEGRKINKKPGEYVKSYLEATSRGGVVSGMLGFLNSPGFIVEVAWGDGRIRGRQTDGFYLYYERGNRYYLACLVQTGIA